MNKKRSKLESTVPGVLMCLPALMLILLVHVYPLMMGLGYAFQDFRLNRPLGQLNFVGLENFAKALADDKFYGALGFSFVNALGVVFLSYVAGFALALLLNRKIPLRGAFRAIFLIPWVISNTVSATNWTWLLNDQYGFVNAALKSIGVIDKSILFLATIAMARVTVIVIGAWKSLPFMMIVLLAGMQSIPGELYESAGIDGAGFWRSLWHITVPSLRSVTTMCTLLMFIWTFNNFEMIYLLTSGGPSNATNILPIYIYNTAFSRGKVSYASAISVIIMLIMMAISLARLRVERKAAE